MDHVHIDFHMFLYVKKENICFYVTPSLLLTENIKNQLVVFDMTCFLPDTVSHFLEISFNGSNL